ncbi:unnamed protein product [Auanema sp. JU1783]|nr:unnamed protein product [Auanema sp. JU1783]
MEETCKYGIRCYRKNREHINKFHQDHKEPEKKRKRRENGDVEDEKIREKSQDAVETISEHPKQECPKILNEKVDKRLVLEKFFNIKSDPVEAQPVTLSNISVASTATISDQKSNQEALDDRSPPSSTFYHVSKSTRKFWEHVLTLSNDSPRKVFSQFDEAELVGVFEQLEGSLFITEQQFLTYHRHSTDLPEMETCLIHKNGHYAIWRDIPNDDDFLIVHSDGKEHFPTIEIVGPSFEHILLHLAGESINLLKKSRGEAIRKRKKAKLGSPPHPLGILIRVINDVGYRDIPESPSSLKKNLEIIGTATDQELIKRRMAKINELYTYAQFANDESDFGMGLEFGHWLFLANYPPLDKITRNTLRAAYELLQRERFQDIAAAILTKRRSQV